MATPKPTFKTAGEELGALRKKIFSFWIDHGPAFTSWWTALSISERRKVLKERSVEMPATSTKAGVIAPEYNLEDLTEEALGVLSKFEDVLSVDSVVDLGAAELSWLRSSYAKKILSKRMPTKEEIGQIVQIRGAEETFGSNFTMLVEKMDKSALENMKAAIELGQMCDRVDWEFIYKRTGIKLVTCMALADHYLQDVLEKEDGTMGARCRACNKTAEEAEGGKLLTCVRCKAAKYCGSGPCQKKVGKAAHWLDS